MSATLTFPRWTRIAAPVAALWYAFGLSQAVIGYIADAASAPLLIWGAYGLACVAGLVGSGALFFQPAKASMAFAVSFVSAAAYFGWVFVFGTPAGEDYGIGAVVLAVTLALWMASRRV